MSLVGVQCPVCQDTHFNHQGYPCQLCTNDVIDFSELVACPTCNGSGILYDSSPCSYCGTIGRVSIEKDSAYREKHRMDLSGPDGV